MNRINKIIHTKQFKWTECRFALSMQQQQQQRVVTFWTDSILHVFMPIVFVFNFKMQKYECVLYEGKTPFKRIRKRKYGHGHSWYNGLYWISFYHPFGVLKKKQWPTQIRIRCLMHSSWFVWLKLSDLCKVLGDTISFLLSFIFMVSHKIGIKEIQFQTHTTHTHKHSLSIRANGEVKTKT